MTKVRFYARDGLLFGVEARGHSGYATAGNDIVCAAVSAVMAVCESYLTDVCGYATEVLQSDEPMISVRLKSSSDEEKQNCHRILSAAKATLEENAREYASHLRISVCAERSGKKI